MWFFLSFLLLFVVGREEMGARGEGVWFSVGVGIDILLIFMGLLGSYS